MSTGTLVNFYRVRVESILAGSITVWYGKTNTQDHKRHQRVVFNAEKIIGTALPSIEAIYADRFHTRGQKTVRYPSHAASALFSQLPSILGGDRGASRPPLPG